MSGTLKDAVRTLPPRIIIPCDKEWLNGESERPHDLATRLRGTYRHYLESAGWDVDLLTELPTVDQPAMSVRVVDDNVEIHLSRGHHLHPTVRDLAGVRWDGVKECWRGPLQPRTVQQIRTTFIGQQVDIDDESVRLLRAAAAQPIPTEIVVDGEIIKIVAPVDSKVRDDLQRIPLMHWSVNHWAIPAAAENAERVINVAERHHLVVASEVTQLRDKQFTPLDYDLTMHGLAGVPLSDLDTVATAPTYRSKKSLTDRMASMGLESVWDLLMHIPLRYLDRNNKSSLSSLRNQVGETATFLVRIVELPPYDARRKMARMTVSDGTGRLEVTFFRSPWVNRLFRRGDEVLLHGKVSVWTPKSGRGKFQMSNPLIDAVDGNVDDMVPVYPQSIEKSKVSTWDVYKAASEAVTRLGDLVDPFDDDLLARLNLISRKQALIAVHRPSTLDDVATGRRRLAYDELLRMQLVLGIRRGQRILEQGVTHQPTGTLTSQYEKRLPYTLTNAQQRVIGEIVTDLKLPYPMNRILQGDVGSGKTVVAALTMLTAIESGYQAALMAPTEILASQLFRELEQYLANVINPETGLPLTVVFLGGKTTTKNRRTITTGLADGSVNICVGTHALLTDDVQFANLGLVVIDEQHRFGVSQRALLRDRNGTPPDVLAMTATPIPRSAALTMFGDLEQSVLDELPPGRTSITTTWMPCEAPIRDDSSPIWATVREHVAQGRQGYVVASLVSDNEKIAAASAEETFTALSHGPLAGLKVGMVHGQMSRDDRAAAMDAFTQGHLDVLVATTVIEVGVNVPNATIMVVLDAARFGIAQLHQIRGRVGRGQHQSACILVGEASTYVGKERMEALVASTDGFHLSEVDLKLRGGGTLFGTQQSGQSDLKVARLPDDIDLVMECRRHATDLLANDPTLQRRPVLRAEVSVALDDASADALSRG